MDINHRVPELIAGSLQRLAQRRNAIICNPLWALVWARRDKKLVVGVFTVYNHFESFCVLSRNLALMLL